jgi:hypothetical protein
MWQTSPASKLWGVAASICSMPVGKVLDQPGGRTCRTSASVSRCQEREAMEHSRLER